MGCCLWLAAWPSLAQSQLKTKLSEQASAIQSKVVAWRRDFHEHPELGNQEVRTAGIVAQHLRSLGIDVKEKVARTGVIGVLVGGKPGPVVALRADMDALPVTERGDLPFKSKNVVQYMGQSTGVMHACGHDAHVAMLMGVAEILAANRKDLAGTVKFIFQPAEEGVYDEKGNKVVSGAELMVQEGALENPKVDVIFGLHIEAAPLAGSIEYRPGATMAAVDQLNLSIRGKQAHGANPWLGADPIVASAQVILGLQTIVSRNVNLTEDPAVVTVGAIHGGIRENIIPERVDMKGTIRTFGKAQRQLVHQRIQEVASQVAAAAGAKAELNIATGYPVTYNEPALVEKMLPTLEAIVGKSMLKQIPAHTGAEDFSYFQEKVPGFFFFLGARPANRSMEQTAAHHTPDFYISEEKLDVGVKALSHLVVDYFQFQKK